MSEPAASYYRGAGQLAFGASLLTSGVFSGIGTVAGVAIGGTDNLLPIVVGAGVSLTLIIVGGTLLKHGGESFASAEPKPAAVEPVKAKRAPLEDDPEGDEDATQRRKPLGPNGSDR